MHVNEKDRRGKKKINKMARHTANAVDDNDGNSYENECVLLEQYVPERKSANELNNQKRE